ncbi:MAG: phage tail sheath C-terminal domain-containing protein [Hyphomicrobiaceae bacterium]|nr:phage tail protein [Hyphomicrobiaceae bacterium]
MPISPIGQINTTALTVPDVYVQIVPPQLLINGIPSNIGGLVGVATWGPVNQPVITGSPAEWASIFGIPTTRTHDMSTHAMIAFEGRASAIKAVRVTNGTETFATTTILATCLNVASKHKGSGGNGTKIVINKGSKLGTVQVRIQRATMLPEIFDNVGLGLTDNALWLAIEDAIMLGVPNGRGPSQIVTCDAGAGTAAPAYGTAYSLAGGSDGDGVITEAILLGTDVNPRTGMYALRGQDVSVLNIADLTSSTAWTTMQAFGQIEGCEVVNAFAKSTSIADARAAKDAAGIDDWVMKFMHGDWVYWNDTYSGMSRRLVSPQAYMFGKLLALAPQHSPLNKQMNSVVATERSIAGIPYTEGDLQELRLGGIDVIANPCPGGRYFGSRIGCNASSNAATHGDNYTRMTHYISKTLNRAMGIYIGELQSTDPNDDLRRRAKATLDAFLTALQEQKQIDAFQVSLDLTNNPANRIALGHLEATVRVRYLSVVEFFIINLEGGQTVTVTRRDTQSLAA